MGGPARPSADLTPQVPIPPPLASGQKIALRTGFAYQGRTHTIAHIETAPEHPRPPPLANGIIVSKRLPCCLFPEARALSSAPGMDAGQRDLLEGPPFQAILPSARADLEAAPQGLRENVFWGTAVNLPQSSSGNSSRSASGDIKFPGPRSVHEVLLLSLWVVGNGPHVWPCPDWFLISSSNSDRFEGHPPGGQDPKTASSFPRRPPSKKLRRWSQAQRVAVYPQEVRPRAALRYFRQQFRRLP